MKKLVAVILTAVMAVGLLAGCGSQGGTSAETEAKQAVETTKGVVEEVVVEATSGIAEVEVDIEQEELDKLIAEHTTDDGRTFVTFAIADDPGTMFPQGSGNIQARNVVMEGVFEGLFQYQGTGGEMKPVLAESYEMIDNGEGWTFRVKLKDYVYDSEGNHFTANDVKFVLDDMVKEYNAYYGKKITGVTVIDEFTAEIAFNSYKANDYSTAITTYLYTQAAYEASPDKMITTPVGTGPYKLTEWTSGSTLTVEKRDDYWESDESKIVRNSYSNVDIINFKVIKDSAQQLIALEKGEIDACAQLPVIELDRFAESGDYNIFTNLADTVVTLGFNPDPSNSACSDINVRKAVCLGFDAQGVVDAVEYGKGEVTCCTFIDIFQDYDSKWESEEYFPYDVAAAKQALADAGYADGITLRLLYENSEKLNNVAQILQSYLSEIGITLELLPTESSLYTTYSRDFTQFDVTLATSGSSTFGSFGSINRMDDTFCQFVEGLSDMTYNASKYAYSDWSYCSELHYEIKDNYYMYGIYAPLNYNVTTKIIKGFVLTQKGSLSPNCCEYIWND